MKTRAEWEAEPMIGNQRAEVLALLDERDEARHDVALLGLDLVKLSDERDAARANVARLREALALAAAWGLCPPSTAMPRSTQDEYLEDCAAVRAALAATDSAQWLAEHDTRVRIAALADAPFVAAALEAARLEALEAAADAVRARVEESDNEEMQLDIIADRAAEAVLALKETKPTPAKPCATCNGSGRVHVPDWTGRNSGPCPDCAEVRR